MAPPTKGGGGVAVKLRLMRHRDKVLVGEHIPRVQLFFRAEIFPDDNIGF